MIVFVASHPAPVEHFTEFRKVLGEERTQLIVKEDTDEVRKACEHAKLIFVGIGNEFCFQVIEEFRSRVIVYYENPKKGVPGEYGRIAEEAIQIGARVMYANKNLATKEGDIGLGYYPLKEKVILYLGGANEVYYKTGFTAFYNQVSAMSFERPTVLVIRPHPRGKGGDVKALMALQKEHLRVEVDKGVDEESLNVSLARAHHVAYHQTSLEERLNLERKDAIGPDRDLASAISDKVILDRVGYNPEWKELLYDQVAACGVEL